MMKNIIRTYLLFFLLLFPLSVLYGQKMHSNNEPFGRFPSLQPVTWKDGFPMVGVNDKAVVTYKKPDVGKEYPIKIFPTSDEFNDTELGVQCGCNHNPEPSKLSLTENPGYLKHYTVNVTDSLTKAPNTLTKRLFAYYSDSTLTIRTTKHEIDNMKDSDIAGSAIFQDPYAFVSVRMINGKKYVVMAECC